MPNPTSPSQGSDVFTEYLYANLIFWGFLVLAAGVAFAVCGAVWDEVTSGVMEFLFVVMGGGFTLVSVVDYLYGKAKSPREDSR